MAGDVEITLVKVKAACAPDGGPCYKVTFDCHANGQGLQMQMTVPDVDEGTLISLAREELYEFARRLAQHGDEAAAAVT